MLPAGWPYRTGSRSSGQSRPTYENDGVVHSVGWLARLLGAAITTQLYRDETAEMGRLLRVINGFNCRQASVIRLRRHLAELRVCRDLLDTDVRPLGGSLARRFCGRFLLLLRSCLLHFRVDRLRAVPHLYSRIRHLLPTLLRSLSCVAGDNRPKIHYVGGLGLPVWRRGPRQRSLGGYCSSELTIKTVASSRFRRLQSVVPKPVAAQPVRPC